MYHYVREADPDLPYFRFLHIENFRRQLDHFESEFGFVTREEWTRFIREGVMPKEEGKVVLTFDDALRDHHSHVFPELVRRGLWGIFYLPAAPFLHGTVLDVHRVHLLCGAFEGSVLFDTATRLVTDDMLSSARVDEFHSDPYALQENRPGVTEFKRLVNYFVAHEHRTGLLDAISETLSAPADHRRVYLSESRIAEMASGGMVLGAHTVTHPVMSTLPREAQRREIEDSLAFMARFPAQEFSTYCHPYGGFHSFDAHTLDLLEKAGVDYAMSFESRQIEGLDLPRNRFHLPRFDCNEFPFGKAD
jgi:peptidoglycan/xylan/chitin deacetylase (PgdA/CDA1 family)